MPIPDFQTLMLPVLQATDRPEVRIGEIIERLASDFDLTEEERAELLPSGRQTTFANRVHWARTYLGKAGLVRSLRRGAYTITDRGKAILSNPPARITISFLEQFPEFEAFRARPAEVAPESAEVAPESLASVEQISKDLTPDETMRAAHERLQATLGQELLERILAEPPAFFERLVVLLLTKMGYGGSVPNAGRALGRSGDGGVDGVIDQDALGLDRIYVQAKRYQPENMIGSDRVRDFSGSLEIHRATKGLFVTTSGYTDQARQTAAMLNKRIVLIDGSTLTRLLIRHEVGCRVQETLAISKIDSEFFEADD